jgi:hypothetical protein
LRPDQFRNITLKCLTEAVGLHGTPEHNGKIVATFNAVVAAVAALIPENTGK